MPPARHLVAVAVGAKPPECTAPRLPAVRGEVANDSVCPGRLLFPLLKTLKWGHALLLESQRNSWTRGNIYPPPLLILLPGENVLHKTALVRPVTGCSTRPCRWATFRPVCKPFFDAALANITICIG